MRDTGPRDEPWIILSYAFMYVGKCYDTIEEFNVDSKAEYTA